MINNIKIILISSGALLVANIILHFVTYTFVFIPALLLNVPTFIVGFISSYLGLSKMYKTDLINRIFIGFLIGGLGFFPLILFTPSSGLNEMRLIASVLAGGFGALISQRSLTSRF